MLSSTVSGSVFVIIFVLGLTSWMGLARIVRANMLSLKNQEFVLAARSTFGGLARVAFTIESARAAGPTLVIDGGDSVFRGGTWWCARDAGATSRLLSVAGYDVAAIGNHDLERGPQSLCELLEGGRRLVSTNLAFDDDALAMQIPPADELDDDRSYTVVVSQLVAEGGLDWTPLCEIEAKPRPLDITCAEVVWQYVATTDQAQRSLGSQPIKGG